MAVTVDTAKPILVELKGFKRYVWNGTLFTAGVAYSCNEQEAKILLDHDCDGIRPFRTYVPKAARRTAAAEDLTPITSLPKKEIKAARVTPPVVEGQAIKVGTPEEEKELFGETDGPTTAV